MKPSDSSLRLPVGVVRRMALLSGCVLALGGANLGAGSPAAAADSYKEIEPILESYCFDCHAEGTKKGGVVFDEFRADADAFKDPGLWVQVLKNIRAGMMPPARKERLSPADFAKLEDWIKRDALQLDPNYPDPGHVTLRRLNRVEYRNTIRDLMGIDFRTDEEFPADDTGYGFDTIGDVLTTSPMLLEKYMQAAETIVGRAVPLAGRVAPQRAIDAYQFKGEGSREGAGAESERNISLYDRADLSTTVEVPKSGAYRVLLNSPVRRSYAYDPGRADGEWFIDGKRELQTELKWVAGSKMEASTEVHWEAGPHELRLAMKPLLSPDQSAHTSPEGPTSVSLAFQGATVVGPLDVASAVAPKDYARFFSRPEAPADPAERLVYAEEILRRFTARAFRRPADEGAIHKLSALAMDSAALPGGTFEKGIARAMTAVIASPRFLFRMEGALPESDPKAHPLLDEWALASRLSYFLWSTMPDEELFQAAERGELRQNLRSEIERMIADERSAEFVKNFAGQWLQTRDVESVSIDARIVQARDDGGEQKMRENYAARQRINLAIDQAVKDHDDAKADALRKELAEIRAKTGGDKKTEFPGSLRSAMRREAEMLFGHLLRTNGSVLKLIDSDSTFLNQELADYYGIPEVHGSEMRLVKLPEASPRGGVLTMGAILAVTSNPTRTSPVKRGLFILENILGTPTPPPPPNIPALEASGKNADGSERSLREALALHREKPICASCHDRMDPLGLAFENFNAMGRWREKELGVELPSPAGKLITGEAFADVKELKRVLATARRDDFYRCLTEKLLTYALGRGPEPCDITTVDSLVEGLRESGGQFASLITGIVESAPFQRRQRQIP